MDMDLYYIKIFLSPFLGFSFAMLVMKCCCKRRCFSGLSASELQRRDTPIYIIPVSAGDHAFDRSSLSPATQFAPPPYDSVVSALPPPPAYSQQKVGEPEEEPPAYSDIVEAEPTFASSLPSQARWT